MATCRFIKCGEGVFFIGPSGTGKIHLAKALCHQACKKYLSAAFYSFYHFFNELEKAELKNQLSVVIKKLIKIDLLVIDDFAFKKNDPKSSDYFYNIVDARYAVKSIILTSNMAITNWPAVFPDPLVANAAMDRIVHHSYQIIIKRESYCRNLVNIQLVISISTTTLVIPVLRMEGYWNLLTK